MTIGPLVTFRKPYQIQGLIYYENLLDSTLSEEFTLFEENVASVFFHNPSFHVFHNRRNEVMHKSLGDKCA